MHKIDLTLYPHLSNLLGFFGLFSSCEPIMIICTPLNGLEWLKPTHRFGTRPCCICFSSSPGKTIWLAVFQSNILELLARHRMFHLPWYQTSLSAPRPHYSFIPIIVNTRFWIDTRLMAIFHQTKTWLGSRLKSDVQDQKGRSIAQTLQAMRKLLSEDGRPF